jgi:hypothetical protein
MKTTGVSMQEKIERKLLASALSLYLIVAFLSYCMVKMLYALERKLK